MDIILIPAYKPDERLVDLVGTLAKNGCSILVVDDGSGVEFAPVFQAVSKAATVIRQPQNTGKGAALKKGLASLPELFPDCDGFITADADGQHTPEDILRLMQFSRREDAIVLTERDLDRHIPVLSRVGNDLSRVVFTLLTGRYFKDNQSGLRRFSMAHRDWLLQVPGDKYDFEMNQLYYAMCMGVPIETMPIRTVYIEENKSSHFDPLPDTLRIYKRLFASAMGSCLAFLLSVALVILLSCLLGFRWACLPVLLAGVAGALLGEIIRQKVTFRGIQVHTVGNVTRCCCRYCVYTVCCMVGYFAFPSLPLWVTFLIAGAVGLPLRVAYARLFGKN